MLNALKTLVAAALVLAATQPSRALTIDSFDGSNVTNLVYFSGGPPVQSLLQATSSAPVPGGGRRTELVADFTAAGYSNASLSGSGDLWAFAGLGQRLNFNFSYGTQNAMNLDLSGMSLLRLDMYLSTPMKLVVYATTQTSPGGNPDGSAFTIDMPDLFRQSFDIPLASFTTNSITGRPVNWADVDGLGFFLSAAGPIAPSVDAFWANSLVALPVAVPEPGSALLLAGALVLLVSMRKKGAAARTETAASPSALDEVSLPGDFDATSSARSRCISV